MLHGERPLICGFNGFASVVARRCAAAWVAGPAAIPVTKRLGYAAAPCGPTQSKETI